MKQKYTLAFALVLPLAALLSMSTIAQQKKTVRPQQQQLMLLNEEINGSPETLSGINLYHIGKGAYQLDFSQKLKENATLSIINTARKVVYQKPVNLKGSTSTWRYKLGKLKPDTYLVQVVTSDTTFWTKFKVGR